ncbi:hypothetical protein NLX83_21625 [Allokutzneria sp. A3M-2-11 16]|uniref:hypothetical protein n=1 Tax=Allokutzneria sp. A3M-2-11 16 TaxID=2962043 RepID=UPI0020B80FF2|nr:hypothetical protein [Allokutzneria sp. A3M-2-11 16]MCP3801870.1 hypothetical protein [Allokutzneria sp. A3M-2-11 16]
MDRADRDKWVAKGTQIALQELIMSEEWWLHGFGNRARDWQPDVIAVTRLWQHTADVVVLHSEERAVAYRAPEIEGNGTRFAPRIVTWIFAGAAVDALRAMLRLPLPGSESEPYAPTAFPSSSGIPNALLSLEVVKPLRTSCSSTQDRR